MADVQLNYIKKKDAVSGQSGTITYDLPEKGMIPEIIVTGYCTPTASTNPALPLNDAITKIEVVDGGTVLQSLTGNQLHGLAMVRGEHTVASPETNDNAVEGRDDFRLVLGGYINGVNYCPDFSQFANPQLKISWDHSITTTQRGMSCDADASPAQKFTVMAKIVRGSNQYRHGYIKSSEIYTFTQAASTMKQVEIPRGEQLLGIGVEAGYAALQLTDDLTKVRLDLDNGAWVPLELDAEEVVSSQRWWFRDPFEVSGMSDAIDAKAFDFHMGVLNNCAFTYQVSGGRCAGLTVGRAGVQAIDFMDVATPTAIGAYEQLGWKATGWAPYGMWYLPMAGILNGEGDLLDTTRYSRINLELTSGASASTSNTPSVMAEYLMTD